MAALLVHRCERQSIHRRGFIPSNSLQRSTILFISVVIYNKPCQYLSRGHQAPARKKRVSQKSWAGPTEQRASGSDRGRTWGSLQKFHFPQDPCAVHSAHVLTPLGLDQTSEIKTWQKTIMQNAGHTQELLSLTEDCCST